MHFSEDIYVTSHITACYYIVYLIINCRTTNLQNSVTVESLNINIIARMGHCPMLRGYHLVRGCHLVRGSKMK